MGETQIDLNNQSSTTVSATGGHQEEFQAFISTGRTGRRNAIQSPDTLAVDNRDADNTINVVHLAQQLQSLKTPSSINDGEKVAFGRN